MIGSSTVDTVIPVADQCELAGVPCITADDPWQAFFFGRKGDPPKASSGPTTSSGASAWSATCSPTCGCRCRPTRRSATACSPTIRTASRANNEEHGMPATFSKKGFDVDRSWALSAAAATTSPRRSRQLKTNNCEIACGIFNPPQFATFWTQCAQQGYRPKIVTPPKALLFPTAVEALGDRGTGISTEVWWSHHHPFKSGLTGQTAQQFCDAYDGGDRQAVDPADRLQARQSRSRDRRAQARQEARADAIRDAIKRRPTTTRWSVRSPGRAGR